MKLNKPSLKFPRINTKFLLIVAGVLLLVALFAYGAVRKVQADKAAEVQTALNNQKAAAQVKAEHDAFAKTQGELNVQTNKALAACGVLKQYATATTTKKLVSYPPVCNVTP